MELKPDTSDHALYFRLDQSAIGESEEVRPGTILDSIVEGTMVGFEILSLSTRVSAERPLSLPGQPWEFSGQAASTLLQSNGSGGPCPSQSGYAGGGSAVSKKSITQAMERRTSPRSSGARAPRRCMNQETWAG